MGGNPVSEQQGVRAYGYQRALENGFHITFGHKVEQAVYLSVIFLQQAEDDLYRRDRPLRGQLLQTFSVAFRVAFGVEHGHSVKAGAV